MNNEPIRTERYTNRFECEDRARRKAIGTKIVNKTFTSIFIDAEKQHNDRSGNSLWNSSENETALNFKYLYL